MAITVLYLYFFIVWKSSRTAFARARRRGVSDSTDLNHTMSSFALCCRCRIHSHIHRFPERSWTGYSTGSLSRRGRFDSRIPHQGSRVVHVTAIPGLYLSDRATDFPKLAGRRLPLSRPLPSAFQTFQLIISEIMLTLINLFIFPYLPIDVRLIRVCMYFFFMHAFSKTLHFWLLFLIKWTGDYLLTRLQCSRYRNRASWK